MRPRVHGHVQGTLPARRRDLAASPRTKRMVPAAAARRRTAPANRPRTLRFAPRAWEKVHHLCQCTPGFIAANMISDKSNQFQLMLVAFFAREARGRYS